MANSRIGAENLTLAKILTDVASGATTYDTPFAISKKLIKVSVKHASNMDPQYADDQTVDIYTDDGDITIDIDITDLTEDEKAIIFGQTMAAGVRTPSPTDVKPYYCVSWKSKKRNNSYKYYKVLKVMFKEPDEDFETKADKTSPQTDKISGTGIQRLSDGLRKRIADADSTSFVAGTGTGWFTTGDITPDVTPPTVTVVPDDAATGVVASANVVWTFSEAILASLVTAANFFVIKADGTAVAGALSIGTNDTVVTFNPTEDLAASAAYIAIATVGVKDKSGNALAENSVSNFTVAS
jgi:phi13 family phage major tail protein